METSEAVTEATQNEPAPDTTSLAEPEAQPAATDVSAGSDEEGGPVTPVNDVITDAVTQTNIDVLGDGPALAMAHVYQSMANAVSLAMQNAVMAQQRASVVAQAVTARCVTSLLGSGPGAPNDSTTAELLDRLKSTAPGMGA